LIALLCVGLWQFSGDKSVGAVSGADGVWDLTGLGWDSPAARLEGDVEYIPGALLTPEEFAERAGAEARIGDPSRIGATAVTTRTRILLPEGMVLGIAGVSPLPGADRVYVNGALVAARGTTADSQTLTANGELTLNIAARPLGGEVVLVRQLAKSHHSGWEEYEGYVVGPTRSVSAYISRTERLNEALIFVFLALAMTHLLAGIVLRQFRANICAAASCLVFTASTVVGAFPDALHMGWQTSYRLLGIIQAMAAVCLVQVLHQLFPRMVAPAVRWGVTGASAAYALLRLALPLSALLAADTCYAVLLSCAVMCYAVGALRRIRETGTVKKFYLAALGVFLVTAAGEFAAHNGLLKVPAVSAFQAAAIAFMLIQTAVVFTEMMERTQKVEQRRAELTAAHAELSQAEALKTQVMQQIAHETLTPLAVISGYADMIAADLGSGAGVRRQNLEDLAVISSEAHRLAAMMGEAQTLAPEHIGGSGREAAPGDAAEAMRNAARLFAEEAHERGLAVTVGAARDIPPVAVPPDQLVQVLVNLLSNAVRHTAAGSITLEAQAAADRAVVVKVRDTGCGIPADILPRVLESGVAGPDGNTGLGLAIVRRIIEAHLGKVAVESGEGVGTVVTLTLPMAVPGVAGMGAAARPESGAGPTGTVLVVEDNRKLRTVTARALRGTGHEVQVAATLDEARATLDSVSPDVILLDVGMPDGDGYAFAGAIRQAVDAHILFVTARAAPDDRARGLAVGGDDYITKPYALEELMSRVTAAMRRRSMTPVGDPTAPVTWGPLRLDPTSACAFLDGRDLRLAPKEFALLYALTVAAGRALTGAELHARAWAGSAPDSSQALRSSMSRLRKKLGTSGVQIVYAKSAGYSLTAYDAAVPGGRA
jgi:signal transduction histidine kinase/DNA-binding response OmpR family regulator